MNHKTIQERAEISKQGLPVMWEAGGGMTNTGDAQIIADRDMGRKKAIYIKQKGSLSCSDHALFVIEKGDHVIRVGHHREDFTVRIYRIRDIRGAQVTLELEWEGEEETQDDKDHIDAVAIAKRKATTYHCRQPMFFE